MSNERYMLINISGLNSVQDLQFIFNNSHEQKPLELTLKVLLGLTIEISLIDDSILLIESKNCEIRLDIAKTDVMKMIKQK
ncbi:MAG: hypothetical protein ACFFAE_15765 [Candidatus Hodarchaeota archaeon]